jgi:glycosyltransferase involved in cell wall biosynthesis
VTLPVAAISHLPAVLARSCAQRAKRLENWQAAARWYRLAVACDARSAATWVQYGNALRETGALSAAESAYRRSLQLDDGNPDAHLQLGHVLKLQRRASEAVAAYRRAVALDPLRYEASLELLALGSTVDVGAPPEWLRDAMPAGATAAPLAVFDATDMLLHLLHSRTVTGIQRVQLCLIASLLREPPPDTELAVAFYRQSSGDWVAIGDQFFLRLASLIQAVDVPSDRDWREAMRQLIALTHLGEPCQFRAGAALVNLGASWSLPNYFLSLRNLKARLGVRYVPFVHDCIPALFPEWCAPQTARDYAGWLASAFRHADGFLVNSATTAADLTRLARLSGQPIEAPHRIALNGAFADRGQWQTPGASPCPGLSEPFVLFVGSFEQRKNHPETFGAWCELIARRGRRNTPLLVCVGGRGWQAETALAMLRDNRALRHRVRLLSGVPDAALARLYRDCLFTVYPSRYEGWGLPVTESLWFGKLPLLSDVPALREAGGDLAEYFDPRRQGDLCAKLQRLIDDTPYRAAREAAIRRRFRPRQWRAVAQEVIDALQERRRVWQQQAIKSPAGLDAAAVEVGRSYPIAAAAAPQLHPGMPDGEIFRMGSAWWAPEEWGCWVKPGHAELRFRLPRDTARVSIHLDVIGNPLGTAEFAVSGLGCPAVEAVLGPGERRRVVIGLDRASNPDRAVWIRIEARTSETLAGINGGLDPRVVSFGICGFVVMPEDGEAAVSRASGCSAVALAGGGE